MSRLHLTLLLLSLSFSSAFCQTSFREIASNRIIQKYQSQGQLEKIAALDSTRIQTLWNYFTASFTFTTEEQNLDVAKLLNIYHFDVYAVEAQRDMNNPVSFTFHDNVTITLLPGSSLNQLLGSYNLVDLVEKIPPRPFPTWTAQAFTDVEFQAYKEKVWDWARDYPTEYLAYTSNPAVVHIKYKELKEVSTEKRNQILEGNYLIID